jgi:hypothetical protein
MMAAASEASKPPAATAFGEASGGRVQRQYAYGNGPGERFICRRRDDRDAAMRCNRTELRAEHRYDVGRQRSTDMLEE